MSSYGEPDWATPGAATTSDPPPAAVTNVNTGVGNKAPTPNRSQLWFKLISIILIGLCAAMVSLGVFVILNNRSVKDFAEWFIASYMILFAGLLFFYELMWWCAVGPLNKIIRKNFGFIYSIRGKALYLIFVACLCIGIENNVLGDKAWLRWFTGLGWGISGVVLLGLTMTKSEMFEEYRVPTAGFDRSTSSGARSDEINETV